MGDLFERARRWLTEDPDPQTRAELAGLLQTARSDDAAATDLADRFAGTLQFGTAGLRGALGPGPNRMNRVVVIRAAAGLTAYLDDIGADGPVVVGYDARHNSDVFARDTAEVVTGAGRTAYLLPRPLPTPVLAHAIRELGCAAGVMVTASHNPPQDNGYKVYLGEGCQIVPPADTEIARRIDAVGAIADVPRGAGANLLGEEVVDSYLTAVAGVVQPGPRNLRVVHTPLHGVGGDPVARVLASAGFTDVHPVQAQAAPDPEFPTVAFPNPEEPGAMDLALETAAACEAELVVANDPDADRCAAAVPDGDDGWRLLRGDEIGALLADHLLRNGRYGVYATTIVSSTLLAKMAAAHGQPYAETLTGFKWIGRIPGLVFGYEEALGFCVDPAHVADKDGISALLLLCDIAARAKADGLTLLDLLDQIAVEHGLHATDQLSVRVHDLGEIATAMQRLRASPPATLGGLDVEAAEDLRPGSDRLPPTDGVRYRLADARVVVRPSGTEPKLKCYLEAVVPVVEHDVAAARRAADVRLTALRTDIAAAAGLDASDHPPSDRRE